MAGDTETEILELKNEVNRLRLQLAACLTAAEGFVQDPPAQDQHAWSFAYQKVLEMARREREVLDTLEELETEVLAFDSDAEIAIENKSIQEVIRAMKAMKKAGYYEGLRVAVTKIRSAAWGKERLAALATIAQIHQEAGGYDG